MGIEGLVNGHDREPEIRHEYIDEEEGSKEAQCHEAQHGSRAPVRAPLRYGARWESDVSTPTKWNQCALTNYLFAICRDRSLNCFFLSNDDLLMAWTGSKLLSALTVTTIGLTSKAFLNSGLCSIQVNGLQTLKDALKSHKRNSGQGIITGSCYFQPLSVKSLNYITSVQSYLNVRANIRNCPHSWLNIFPSLDDPVMWGVLPAKYYLNSFTTRWTLGASDILFTNP